MSRHVLRAFVVAASLVFLSVFVVAAVETVHRGAPPDAVEVALVDQAQRFARHHFAYAEPRGPHAVAVSPGLPAVAAALVGVDSPRLALLRQLALTAMFFAALLLGLVVHQETRSWTLALAAASFALAGQGLFATVPGHARPEALLLLLVLLAFAALRFLAGVTGALLAALLLAVACFVAPQAIAFLVAAAASQLLEGRRRFLAFSLTAGVLLAAGTVVLARLLGPWFTMLAWSAPFEALRFHPLAALRFTTTHLLGRLGLFTCVAVLSFALSTRPWLGPRGLWLWLALAGGVAAIATTQSAAPDPAGLAASIVALALLGTLALQRVVHHLADRYDAVAPEGEGVILAALGVQFVVFLACAADAGWIRAMALAG